MLSALVLPLASNQGFRDLFLKEPSVHGHFNVFIGIKMRLFASVIHDVIKKFYQYQ